MKLPLVRTRAKVRGLGFILWHSRHELVHILLGLVWAWYLREVWQQFNPRWIWTAVFGSLLPDVEHIIYFIVNHSKDEYAKLVVISLRQRQWRFLTMYVEKGHKNNTNLRFHNFYILSFLFILTTFALFIDKNAWVVLFGAMITHYLYDIFDDYLTLGYLNTNWRRWGRSRKPAVEKD